MPNIDECYSTEYLLSGFKFSFFSCRIFPEINITIIVIPPNTYVVIKTYKDALYKWKLYPRKWLFKNDLSYLFKI